MKTQFCLKCGQQHDLKYLKQVNGALSMIYYCPKVNQVIWTKFIPGLDIPIQESRKLQKANVEARQVKLF